MVVCLADGFLCVFVVYVCRADEPGKNIRKHEDYPLVWQAAGYEVGTWSDPYFDCEGYIKDWILSYRVPFFGNTGYGSPTEFRCVSSQASGAFGGQHHGVAYSEVNCCL